MKVPEQFVVRCGLSMYLRAGANGRAGCVENAQKFTSVSEAESAAARLRAQSGVVRLPWTVQAIQGGGAA